MSASSGSAVVVGGGIGGLATAVALLRDGWRVTVLERSDQLQDVGAALSLWPNGVRALNALGLGDAVAAVSSTVSAFGFRSPEGRWLARADVPAMSQRFGDLVMVRRSDLLHVLRQAVPRRALVTGAEVHDVVETTDGAGPVRVSWPDGDTEGDLLVGADGLWSTVRRAIWPAAARPRYVGYTSWRTVVEGPVELEAGGETWGRGRRVGVAGLRDGAAYLFAVANAAVRQPSVGTELDELRRRFSSWHAPIPRLLDAVDERRILRHDLYELPPLDRFASCRTALVGDAAHAMTPDLGQGANQALEDAVTLAACLRTAPDVPSGLLAYDQDRRPRTQAIAARSARIGRLAQVEGRLAVAARDTIMRLTPAAAVLRSQAPILGWRPPA